MPQSATKVRLADVELDVSSAELRKNGVTNRLPEQPFRLLVALLERPGEVVTREELRKRLWTADTFVDFEHGLNAAVKRLREALDDSADRPIFIETIPRRGYRLIAPVEILTPFPDAGAAPVGGLLRKHYTAGAAVLLVVLAVGIAATLRGPGLVDRYRRKTIGSIAVLPLQNFGAPDDGYFADGMTEALTTELTGLKAFRVISRQSAMQYRGTNQLLPQIARELGVDALVEGSVLRVGTKVRISVQLIQATPERHLWAKNYERERTDILSLQREVSQAIASEVKGAVVPGAPAGQSRQVRPAAFDAYLRGRYHFQRFPNGLAASVAAFEEAVALDPTYAPAMAGLALSYSISAYNERPGEMFPKAMSAARKALEIDDRQAEAHAAIGVTKLNFEWDWGGAEREFKRALELDPDSINVHARYATYLLDMRRFEEAIAEAKRGVDLDRVSRYANLHLGWIYLNARRYDDAVSQLGRTLALDPSYRTPRRFLAWTYTLMGKYDEANAAFAQLGIADTAADAAYLHGVSGKRDRALRVIERLVQKSLAGKGDSYALAFAYAGVGDRDLAIRWLTRAFDERNPQLPQLANDPFLDNLRADPRFQELLRRMNYPR